MESNRVKDLSISVSYDGENHEIYTYPNEYRSLMMLIYDNINTEGFGECLGMGKCGTCLVKIISSNQQLSCYERNEETTLLRSDHSAKELRLSCQIIIDEFINGVKLKVST